MKHAVNVITSFSRKGAPFGSEYKPHGQPNLAKTSDMNNHSRE